MKTLFEWLSTVIWLFGALHKAGGSSISSTFLSPRVHHLVSCSSAHLVYYWWGSFPSFAWVYLVPHLLSGLSLNPLPSPIFCFPKAPVLWLCMHSHPKGFAPVEFVGFVKASRQPRVCDPSTPHRSDAQPYKAIRASLTCDPCSQWCSVVMFLMTLMPRVWPISLLRPHSWLRRFFGLDLCALTWNLKGTSFRLQCREAPILPPQLLTFGFCWSHLPYLWSRKALAKLP